jgi:hypothetical protein
MVVVEVFLGLDGRGSIKLNHKIIGGHSGDIIVWNVHSVSPHADSVEIDFVDKNYFRSPSGPPASKDQVTLTGGFGRLIGTIPSLGMHLPAPKAPGTPLTEAHKYTIRSYDGRGGIIAEKDPYVIPSEP